MAGYELSMYAAYFVQIQEFITIL